MKYNIIAKLSLFLLAFTFSTSYAQVHNVTLEQTPGTFVIQDLTLAEGDYQFEIANKGVDHEVGFVLVPKGQYDAANHIKEAYVKAPVATNKSSMTSVVSLKAGEYEYFCPLNPTDKYTLTVTGPEKIKLTQTPGPKGKYDASNHIKAAYVTAPVANGKSSMTSTVALKAGEYEYFCPLNPTAKYPLTVSKDVKNIKLTQVPGRFESESLTLEAGQYQFEIANAGVEHEVGFVVVPKGKYDASNHITTAYVKAPVANGKSSMTSVVSLKPGEYEYFCPLNPTAKNRLTVK